MLHHPCPFLLIWQPRYYGFNIWSRKMAEEKLDYVPLNSVRARFVDEPTPWPWRSALWYLDGRLVGLTDPVAAPIGIRLIGRY